MKLKRVVELADLTGQSSVSSSTSTLFHVARQHVVHDTAQSASATTTIIHNYTAACTRNTGPSLKITSKTRWAGQSPT